MPERNDQPPAAADEAEFLDDDLDLDELAEPEGGVPGADAPELIDDDAADALLVEQLGAELEDELEFEPDGRVQPESVEGEDLEDELDLTPELPPDEVAPAPVLQARVERLESAARTLANAEVTRESRRVRRKVSAATTGAGAVGAVPVMLQLAGAFDLSPELAAAISSAAAAFGALVAGWVTPERKATLPTAVALDVLTRRR